MNSVDQVRATYLAATAAGLDPATVSALELASLKTKNLECVDCGLVTWDSLLWRNVPAKIGPQTWSEMVRSLESAFLPSGSMG